MKNRLFKKRFDLRFSRFVQQLNAEDLVDVLGPFPDFFRQVQPEVDHEVRRRQRGRYFQVIEAADEFTVVDCIGQFVM